MRIFSSIIALLVVAPLTAAPVPKEVLTPPMEVLFGKPFDPSKSCEFKLDGKKLILTVPGTVECPATKLDGAPRTKRAVTGDFEMEVVVSYKLPDPPVGGHAGAGLAIWQDEQHFALANRHHWPAGAKYNGGFDVHYENPDGGGRVSHGAVLDADTGPDAKARLRLRRQGDTVTTWESRDDGKTWNKLTEGECKLPATVSAGVVAFNSIKAKMEVTCDELTIKLLGKK